MKKAMTIAGFLISGVLLWLAVKDTNFSDIGTALKQANFVYVVPVLAALSGFYLLKAVRWKDILSPTIQIRTSQLIPSIMSGAAGNNLLPAHIGELVRIYLLSREFKFPKAQLLATLVVERVLDVISVLILVSIALLFADLTEELKPAILFLVMVALSGFVLTYSLINHSDWFINAAENIAKIFPQAVQRRTAIIVSQVAIGFSSIGQSRLFLIILLNSVVQWSLMSACVYFSLQAISIDIPYYASIIVLAIIVAGLTLPTSPGFIGTIQFCFIIGLASFGVDSSRALVASIFYHTILWSSVTLTGLYFMHRYHVTFRQIKSADV